MEIKALLTIAILLSVLALTMSGIILYKFSGKKREEKEMENTHLLVLKPDDKVFVKKGSLKVVRGNITDPDDELSVTVKPGSQAPKRTL